MGLMLPLEHDPEKWLPVFPRDKREAFARRSCSNKKIERDDDSKKSHRALAECAVVLSQAARKCRSAYPNRSLLRRCLDICSISQSIHTNAMPKPTTTPKNSIKANAVPARGKKAASVQNTPRPLELSRRLKLYLTGPALLPAVKGRQRDQLQTCTGRRRQP